MKNVIIFSMLMGFSIAGFAQKADSTKTPKITLRGISTLGNEPLIIIDGNKQYIRGTSSLNEIDPNNIESVSILKDSLATAQYGTDGFAGVIEVKTKKNQVGNLFKIKPVDLMLNGRISGFNVQPMPNGQVLVKKRDLLFRDIDPKAKPLYVVDGKEMSDIDTLDPSSIESIAILKNSSATTLHGDKGKNGVVVITTKKATSKKN
ncbi:TonB-dependent SusC/RagA subfamily outer membrane receptor [Pedobacter sp. AK013]|uniref:TonB-dependent receptor plug domain-containing protein n=1 Tax=Pedobacter sp. AK013 TaxID=2723071 RepID=UPI00162068FC|nr:TonB-dependent receptor plug domain-containing protein [Pedobacter sp. AK013]MBB6236750.1 TonB-dependent SusC/RagA subfamily outer membrane receptor [Pedobacter sp. AK013]